MNVMRSSLFGSLLQVLKFNLDRKTERLRVFEIGRTFLRDPALAGDNATVAQVRQPMRLAALAFGPAEPLQWGQRAQAVDFFELKGDIEALLAPRSAQYERAEHPALHPGRCARILLDGEAVGWLGELHPKWRQSYELAQAPVMFEIDLEAVLQRPLPNAEPVAKHHPVQRDIAVVVREAVTHQELLAAVWAAPSGGLLRDALMFDLYRPQAAATAGSEAPADAGQGPRQGEKSLAVRLTLYGRDATLADEEIDIAVRAIVQHLAQALQARLRA
jgi:phenylalanyl-tRNA synthetase beta chain